MDVTSSHSFLPLTLLEPALPPDFIYNLTSGGSGQHKVEVNNVYFSFPYEPECLYCLVPYCCGATEGSEQQHNQDLKEIYIRGDEFSNSSFTHLLHEFVGNVKCRMD